MLESNLKFYLINMAAQVEMTTGATIHTTKGLKMTVTRRVKPPVVPILETPTMNMEASASLSQGDTLLDQKSEVSSAHS